MPTYRLSRGAVKKVHGAVDTLFDNLKTRALGPKVVGKRLYVAFRRDLSLPGIFEHAASEEGIKPDTTLLDSLLSVASNYLDATRERAKAKVVAAVNAQLGQSSTSKASKDEVRSAIRSELEKVWTELTSHVNRIVETEGNTVRNMGLYDGIVKMNAQHGIEDPTVYFVVVRDDALCEECKRLHLLDGATPRLWKLSEVGHGYHKRGEENPKLSGLHPHCRCVMVTLLPGFGFNDRGALGYIRPGHDELAQQRSDGELVKKSEVQMADCIHCGKPYKEHTRDEQCPTSTPKRPKTYWEGPTRWIAGPGDQGRPVIKMEGQTYGDGQHEWHVPALAQHAAAHYPVSQVPVEHLKHVIKEASTDEPWGSPAFHARAMNADLKHPLVVVQHPEQGLHIADGMHRLYRHIQNGATHVPAYVVPHDKLPKDALVPEAT